MHARAGKEQWGGGEGRRGGCATWRLPRPRACGLPEPIMMKRAGCTMEMPSRSTVLMPEAALQQ